MKTRQLWTAALALAALGACARAPEPAASPAKPRLALVPKGTTHVFWKAVEEGARREAEQRGVELIWKGPLQESDRAQQIQLVQQLGSQSLDGLALAPLDHAALVPAVAQLRASGLPIVIFDSALDGTPGSDFASFVATDNRAGGTLAGQELARLLEAPRKVVILRYQVGSASTQEREEGALAALRAAGAEILVENRYAGATIGDAKNEALNLLAQLREAQGVFCSNEPTSAGMLLALRQAGLAGKLRFVGFDASPPLVEALRAGEIDALVVQDPRKMGALTVRTLLASARHEPVEARIDTGVLLATRANMDSPEVAALLR